VGETVVIAMSFSGVAVEMLSTVRHSNDAKSGFEFYPLSAVAQQGIQNWIQELAKHEQALFPYPYGGAKFGSD
jgi:hypothetical protein